MCVYMRINNITMHTYTHTTYTHTTLHTYIFIHTYYPTYIHIHTHIHTFTWHNNRNIHTTPQTQPTIDIIKSNPNIINLILLLFCYCTIVLILSMLLFYYYTTLYYLFYFTSIHHYTLFLFLRNHNTHTPHNNRKPQKKYLQPQCNKYILCWIMIMS